MEKHPLDHSDLNSSSKRQRRKRQSRKDIPLPSEILAARHPSENQTGNEEFLCDDCRAVDWSSLPTLAVGGLLEKENRELRSVNASFDRLRTSSCRICAILSVIKPRKLNGQRCVLTALPLWRLSTYDVPPPFRINQHALESVSQCTVLIVENARRRRLWNDGSQSLALAVVRLNDLSSRRVTPSSIDYNRLKDLVRMCEKGHKRCHRFESRPNVLGLEVIDTKTKEVVKAPYQCKYLALSYIWGKQAGDCSIHDIQHSPPVIKDAISVTNSMGYNYLWVDRYCIRSDAKEKHRMISQMDQIYANASITIIAASDGDTEMGLCGVSRPRQLQQHVIIQDVSLLELPLGHQALKSSKWASRGWTYQEGYLSTKRLIFTANQILFLCNGSYGSECLQQLLDRPFSTDDTAKFSDLIPRFTTTSRRFSVEDLLNHVQEYSVRDLTRSSDSLNAFLGVLSYYANNSANLTSPVLQLPWGLIASKHSKKSKHAEKTTFGLQIFWSHHNGLAVRRREFPSWSWTGWGGPVKFCRTEAILQPEHGAERDPFSYLNWEMSMQETDGRVMKMYDLTLKEFEARKVKHQLYQPGPKQLLISCLIIPVSFQEFKLTKDQKNDETKVEISDTGHVFPVGRNLSDGFHPTLQVWKGIYVGIDKADLRLDQQVEQQDCILGLIFANRQEKFDMACYYCILARQVDEGLYERAGLLGMNGLGRRSLRLFDLPYEMTSQMVFLDATGSILDNIAISHRQKYIRFIEFSQELAAYEKYLAPCQGTNMKSLSGQADPICNAFDIAATRSVTRSLSYLTFSGSYRLISSYVCHVTARQAQMSSDRYSYFSGPDTFLIALDTEIIEAALTE